MDTDKKILFRDSALYINSSADGQLDIDADTEIEIATTTVDLNGALDVSGALTITEGALADSTVLSADIKDGEIVDADINASAGITNTKLANPNSYFTIAIHHEGQENATVNPISLFQMPFAATLVEVSAAARAADSGDADETYTIDLEEAGTSVLSSPISISRAAPQTPVVGTVSDSAIGDNAVMEVVLTLGGTTPTIDDVTVLMTFKVAHTN